MTFVSTIAIAYPQNSAPNQISVSGNSGRVHKRRSITSTPPTKTYNVSYLFFFLPFSPLHLSLRVPASHSHPLARAPSTRFLFSS